MGVIHIVSDPHGEVSNALYVMECGEKLSLLAPRGARAWTHDPDHGTCPVCISTIAARKEG